MSGGMELACSVDAGHLLGTVTTWCSLTSCETLFAALQLIDLFLWTGHHIFLSYSHPPSTLCIFWMVYLNSSFWERTMSCAHHPNHIFCPHTFWLREKNVNTFSALVGTWDPSSDGLFMSMWGLQLLEPQGKCLDLSCGAWAESRAIQRKLTREMAEIIYINQ